MRANFIFTEYLPLVNLRLEIEIRNRYLVDVSYGTKIVAGPKYENFMILHSF